MVDGREHAAVAARPVLHARLHVAGPGAEVPRQVESAKLTAEGNIIRSSALLTFLPAMSAMGRLVVVQRSPFCAELEKCAKCAKCTVRRGHGGRAGRLSLGERTGFHGRGAFRQRGHSSPGDNLLTAMPAEKSTITTGVTFAGLGVPAPLVAALAETGITVPFPIQAATLPDALAGHDVLGRAQTGSGKTLGFCLPLAARLADGYTLAGRPRGLVLVPTRELAAQVQAVLSPLARAVGLRTAVIFGGTSQNPQVAALRDRADIVVACPGRLADLIEQGHCHLGDVEITVLDEADHMADLGFLPVVRRLLDTTPREGQRLLFSATLDKAVDVLARRFLSQPVRHTVDAVSTRPEITHHLLTVTPADRVKVLATLASGESRVLIFTRTKHGASKLARDLARAGTAAAELHGDLAQGARTRNLAAFASGRVRALVATDIAARGIHVDGVNLVIHADPPAEHKAYVHRSGRTARGGADGTVVTVQTAAQAAEVRTLMRKAGVSPQAAVVDPGSAVLRSIAGPPAKRTALVDTPARPVVVSGQATGRGAVAASGAFRGRRGRRG
jgi:superfamily II DNA/RNA helicase